MRLRDKHIKFILLAILFIAAGAMSIMFGGSQEFDAYIYGEIRLPKTITAILAGSSLSVAGLILQVIFRNPLAGPYVLGISSGSSLMVALTILGSSTIGILNTHFVGKSLIIISSVLGSLGITFIILFLSKKVNSNVVLLLIGLMLAQICSAFESVLQYFSNPNDLKNFVMWGMGSLAGTTTDDLLVFLPLIALTLLSSIFFIKPLNAFLMGQNYAVNSGINYSQNRFYLILISSLLTGVTTAFCGPIAFVGIAVPLISRMMFSVSDQKVHLFSCMLIGSIILLFSDVMCHVLPGTTLPVNMITTLIGAPLVIYLLFKNKQW